jgi:hypothetical protein
MPQAMGAAKIKLATTTTEIQNPESAASAGRVRTKIRPVPNRTPFIIE